MVMDVIAVVTASGKAYYRIVSELKKRGLSFLSLNPGESIPLDIKVAITTAAERDKVHCSNVLIYDYFPDTSILVEKALQIIQGKTKYEEVIIGIDPGKRFGIAVLGDGKVLKVLTTSNIAEAAASVTQMLEMTEGEKKIVRIGNGARDYQLELTRLLDERLSSNVLMESVEEYRTTKISKKSSSWRRDLRDGVSAVEISMRNGRIIKRGETK